jgi:hypothetical protein
VKEPKSAKREAALDYFATSKNRIRHVTPVNLSAKRPLSRGENISAPEDLGIKASSKGLNYRFPLKSQVRHCFCEVIKQRIEIFAILY